MSKKYTEKEYRAYCEIRGQIVGGRICLALVVGVIFTILKALGQVPWSWWVTTAPLWGGIAYGFVATILIAIFGAAKGRDW